MTKLVAGVRTSKLIVRARCLRFVRSFIVRLRVCQFFPPFDSSSSSSPPFQLFLRLFSTIYLRRCPSSSVVSSSSFVPLSRENFSSPLPTSLPSVLVHPFLRGKAISLANTRRSKPEVSLLLSLSLSLSLSQSLSLLTSRKR